jgi:serine/threonine protein kinase
VNVLRHNKCSIRELTTGGDVWVGKKQYRVEQIAQGGMGAVLLLELKHDPEPAAFSLHGARVAVKSVLPQFFDEGGCELFHRELTIWAGFGDPNVVHLDEILEAGPDGWVAAMRWCEGSLRAALRSSGKMSVERATMILCDVVKGLSYAQREGGVLHLDVKPENVLYMPDINRMLRYPQGDLRQHRFMVSDWGLASVKQRQLDTLASKECSPEMRARTFNNMGTILYMAPERFIEGYRSSVASDLFSLGMMYLEMLTGVLPFHADEDPVDVLLSHAYFGRATDLLMKSKILCSSETEAKMMFPLVAGLLMPDPKSRPNSYDELLSMLWTMYKLGTNTFSIEAVPQDPFDPPAAPGSSEEEFEKFTELPLFRRTYLRDVLKEGVEKQAANLRAVGRETEAKEVLENYISLLFREWENEPDDPRFLATVANAAIALGSLDHGRALLESAISRVQSDAIPIDLTHVYFHLGRIHHYLRRDIGDELWCYEMAIQSEAPTMCRYPATLAHKARAYIFARNEAAVKGKPKHEKWYRKRVQQLAPNVDWQNLEDVTRFLASVRDSEEQET